MFIKPQRVIAPGTQLNFFKMALAILLLPIVICLSNYSKALETQYVDSRHVIQELADLLATGHQSAASHFQRLGLGDVLPDAQDVRGYAGFSSRTFLQYAYESAEMGASGDGERLLALLRSDLAKDSARVATSADLSYVARYSEEELKRPFNFQQVDFSTLKRTSKAHSPNVEKAISVLSDHFSDQGMGQARLSILKNLNNPKLTAEAFEEILIRSSSPRDALINLFDVGLPPPTSQKASLNLLKEISKKSGALAIDPNVLDLEAKLQAEVSDDIGRYLQRESRTPSRKAQIAEIKRVAGEGVTTHKPSHKDFIAALHQPPSSPFFPGDGPGAPTVYPQPPNGGGPHTPAGKAVGSYNNYMGRSFEPRSVNGPHQRLSGPAPVSRGFKVAVLSPRAARGIAAGADVQSRVKGEPIEAYWFPLEKDDRFGRLLVNIKGKNDSRIITSRLLFSDSFYSAMTILEGKYGDEAEYQEGDILVVMSMDPDSDVIQKDYASEIQQIEKIGGEAQEIVDQIYYRAYMSEDDWDAEPTEEELATLINLNKKATELAAGIPRGIVIHPALHGRELAWSAARIDFWFNDIDGLEEESRQVIGQDMPAHLKQILNEGEAATWQLYERDAFIESVEVGPGIEQLQVKNDVGETMNRFAVTMFAISDEGAPIGSIAVPDDPGVYRLPELDKAVQPLLDWLSQNHPDYWRMNDFSESFSLLRWLQRSNVLLRVFDMDGDVAILPTPDRIELISVRPLAGLGNPG